MERNRILVHATYLKWPTLLLLSPFLILLELALIPFGVKAGWIGQKGKVWRYLLSAKTWLYVKQTRADIAKIRRVPDRGIVRLWTGRIEHQETDNPIVRYIANPLLSALWGILRALIVW